MAERVLITGGAGFIGSHLAARHLAEGDDVHILVRPARALEAVDGITVHRVDLSICEAVEDCLAAARPTLIHHLASSAGRRYAADEIERDTLFGDLDNLVALLGAAAAVRPPLKALVRAGSLAEYGEGPMPQREDQRERPPTAYTAALVAGAHYCAMLQPSLPFPVRTARLGLTYGPGQSPSFLVPWLIDRCLAREESAIRAPDDLRDMLFVEDAVEGLRCLATYDGPGAEVVNIATGAAPSVREIAEDVARACGCDPALLRFGEGEGRGSRVLWGDPSRAAALLGWRAAVPWVEGLAATVDAHRARTRVPA